MKIAIQGHPTRGKEVIKILESLGGKNTDGLEGTYDTFYYIDDKNEICDDHKKNFSSSYKLYTLEEFEKEFPFKIGDKVSIAGIGHSIIALEYFNNKLCYKLNDRFHYSSKTLKFYNEMKEERNITLTLDKAKEWYKKGGELKEIALQAFSEKELKPLPKSWEEFCDNHKINNSEAYFDTCGEVYIANETCRHSLYDRNMCPSKESAKAHLAMIQLEQLRNCWWNGWKPEWNGCEKHVIKWEGNNLTVFTAGRIHAFLVFPTRVMAEEFLECFRDLIEKAGDLI